MRRVFDAVRPILNALERHRALVALTLLAALVRFATLDVQSFWQDEAITAGQVIRPSLLETLALVPATESTPPLYYALAWAWSQPFGTGEVGLRSMSALLGTATVPVVYRAGSMIGTRTGLVAAALTAANPMLVWYSQEARSYALLVLLTALSFVFFLTALRNPSCRVLTGWTVSAALALVTHYFALLVVAPEAVWLLARAADRRRAALAVAGTAVAGLAILPLARLQAGSGRGGWIATIDLRERLNDTWENFLVGGGPGQVDALLVPIAALVCGGLALLVTRGDRAERRHGLVAVGIGAAAVLLALALAVLGADYLLDRNLLPALVPLTVGVAAGLAARRAGHVGLVAAGLLCALFVSSSVLTATRGELQRPDWRAVAAALGPTSETRLIVAPPAALEPLDIYLPDARHDPAATTATRKVVVIGPAGLDSAPALPNAFRAVHRRDVAGMRVTSLGSTEPVELTSRTLATTAVGASPEKPAAVFVETPGSAPAAD